VGQPTEPSRRLVELAAEATEASIRACGPGVPVHDVVRAADTVIEAGGFLEHRAKFTGHGIGLDTVEAPFIMAESDEVLEAGDVICLEPGILIRDVQGARFEYEVVITETGAEVLAGLPAVAYRGVTHPPIKGARACPRKGVAPSPGKAV
jgi:Xaa-Pro aminopeptidase